MRKSAIVYGLVMIIVSIMLSTAFIFGDGLKEEPTETVKWYTFEEAMAQVKKEPRKLFIDVYTDWCGWCKKMDANTFNHPTVAKYLNEVYYPVKFNAEQKEDLVFKNYTFKYIGQGRRGYHQFAAALLNNQLSYPTVVFLDEELNMIQPLPGYRQASEMYPILEFFGGNHYKSVSWADFKADYKSPFASR